MLKKILAILVMLYAAACFAAVDVNKATAAELDGVKGIGPAISAKIIDERKKGRSQARRRCSLCCTQDGCEARCTRQGC
jgi:hypothetical protein